MKKNKLIEHIYTNGEFYKRCKHVCMRWNADPEEFFHEMIMRMYERDLSVLQGLFDRDKLLNYFARACKLELKSKTSRYYYSHRRYSDNLAFQGNHMDIDRELTAAEYVRRYYPDRISDDDYREPYRQIHTEGIMYEEDLLDIAEKCRDKVYKRLTRRQIEVFDAYQETLSTVESAKNIGISQQTVSEIVIPIKEMIKDEIDKYLSEDH